MKTFFDINESTYNGSQLQSLYSLLNYKVQGNSVISWTGKCDIPTDKIVDGQDLLEGARIYSEDMVHFVIEVFDVKLVQMVYLQRMFCEIIRDEVYSLSEGKVYLRRTGDDLFYMETSDNYHTKPKKDKDFKFNISIATLSPVSGLIHFGVNISSKNTPIKTFSLDDLSKFLSKKINPKEFSEKVMSAFATEFETSQDATQKVKWVR